MFNQGVSHLLLETLKGSHKLLSAFLATVFGYVCVEGGGGGVDVQVAYYDLSSARSISSPASVNRPSTSSQNRPGWPVKKKKIVT